MKNYKLILTIFFIGVMFSYNAIANVTLEGSVKDKKTGMALIGASVSVFDQKGAFLSGAYASNDGSFKIVLKTTGNVTIRTSYLGYKKYTSTMNYSDGDTKSLNIELIQDVVGLEEIVVTGLASKN